jgi:hypothetical protein
MTSDDYPLGADCDVDALVRRERTRTVSVQWVTLTASGAEHSRGDTREAAIEAHRQHNMDMMECIAELAHSRESRGQVLDTKWEHFSYEDPAAVIRVETVTTWEQRRSHPQRVEAQALP